MLGGRERSMKKEETTGGWLRGSKAFSLLSLTARSGAERGSTRDSGVIENEHNDVEWLPMAWPLLQCTVSSSYSS